MRASMKMSGWIVFALLSVAMLRFSVGVNTAAVHKTVAFAVCLALLLSAGIALWWLRRREAAVEHVFLALFVPFSLGMMLCMPIFGATDEKSHLHKSYLISSGQMMTPATQLICPQGLYDVKDKDVYRLSVRDIVKMAHGPAARICAQSESADEGENTGVYPAFAYIPQAIGMYLTRLFSDNRFVMFYGGRLGVWLLTLAMFFLAIRWAPCGKNVILAVSLLPMTLQEAASASVDGPAIACTTLLVAFVLMSQNGGFRLKRRHWLVAAMLAAGLVAFKVLYLPFLFLFWAVPVTAFGDSSSRRRLFLAYVSSCAILVVVVWLMASIVPLLGQETSRVSSFVVPRIREIAGNPVNSIKCFLKTPFVHAEWWLHGLIGVSLSWFNVLLAGPIWMGFAGATAAVVACDRSLSDFPARVRWLLATCAFSSYVIILLSLWIWWTQPGAKVIDGVQGRYFLPILAAVLLLARWTESSDGQRPYPRTWRLYALFAVLDTCAIANVLSYKL